MVPVRSLVASANPLEGVDIDRGKRGKQGTLAHGSHRHGRPRQPVALHICRLCAHTCRLCAHMRRVCAHTCHKGVHRHVCVYTDVYGHIYIHHGMWRGASCHGGTDDKTTTHPRGSLARAPERLCQVRASTRSPAVFLNRPQNSWGAYLSRARAAEASVPVRTVSLSLQSRSPPAFASGTRADHAQHSEIARRAFAAPVGRFCDGTPALIAVARALCMVSDDTFSLGADS